MPWKEEKFELADEGEKDEVIKKLFNYLLDCCDKGFIYRGHSSLEYKLQPSLARETSLIKQADKTFEQIENDMINKFEDEANLYPEGEERKLGDKFQKLAIMQHYGTPTRLLDWTYSPYVALYFSSISNPDKDSVIYCLDWDCIEKENVDIKTEVKNLYGTIITRAPKERIENIFDFIECKKKIIESEGIRVNKKNGTTRGNDDDLTKNISDRIKILDSKILLDRYEPKQKNLRIARQQGLFMVSERIDASYTEILKSYGVEYGKIEDKEVAIKIIIGKDLKQAILKKLDFMNISNKILFLGMEGFCKGIKYSL